MKMYVYVYGSAGRQVIHVPPALPGHCLCRFHCAMKLNTGFSSGPGQVSFLGVWSDTTNLSCLLMPLPTAGLAC